MSITRKNVCRAVAASLVEFGYPDCTADMIDEVLTAWISGKRESDLPHGIIGMFAGKQFQELEARGADLSALQHKEQT